MSRREEPRTQRRGQDDLTLLLGLYTLTEGRILVNGVDVRDIDPSSLWGMSAAVFQDYLKYQRRHGKTSASAGRSGCTTRAIHEAPRRRGRRGGRGAAPRL